VDSRVYVIIAVDTPTQIELDKPFTGDHQRRRAAYSLGPKRVGPPWEVRLPTSLVMIDTDTVTLPSWPDG
jgi:hypothetical protein